MKVVVIGAGVAGLAIGWRLAQSGCKVVVLDRAGPGHGATWASAGMIAATAEGAHGSGALADYGRFSARLWPSFAAEIEQASGRAISYRRDGTLIVAPSSDTASRGYDFDLAGTSVLSPEEALRLEPLLRPDIAGALFAPDDAQVDSRALGMALALALIAAGGVLQVNEAVVRLEMTDSRVVGARTPFALYGADAFVIAAGAWSNGLKGLPPDLLPPIVPVKGEMIALAPLAGTALPIRLVWGNEIYLVPRHDRLFVGATVSREGFDTRATSAAGQWLRKRAVELMPALQGWKLTEHWAGLRPGLSRRSARHRRNRRPRTFHCQRPVPQRHPSCSGNRGSPAQSHPGTPAAAGNPCLPSSSVHRSSPCGRRRHRLTRPAPGRPESPGVLRIMVYQFIGIGFLLFLIGSKSVLRGGIGLSKALGLPPAFVGVLVVSLAMAAPELSIALQATARHAPDIALGDIVGSNIANILLVFGLGALLRPMPGSPRIVFRDGGAMILASIVLVAIMLTGVVSRVAGVVLLLGWIAYLALAIVTDWRRPPRLSPAEARAQVRDEEHRGGISVFLFIFGIVCLYFGGRFALDAESRNCAQFPYSTICRGIGADGVWHRAPRACHHTCCGRSRSHEPDV